MNDKTEIGPVYEGTGNTIRVAAPVGIDLSEMTVYVYCANTLGDTVSVGSITVSAGFNITSDNVDIPVLWSTAGLGGGSIYEVEIIADPSLSTRRVLSAGDYIVTIKDVISINIPT